ncbi:MAG TPA: M20/M25/M40 family metallo-hydrolase [Candidatus Acidoferrales bacterium]|nr:M20/M25/M40 family metallo-hydrolase [Candidatus Acidoferrales bacterium]
MVSPKIFSAAAERDLAAIRAAARGSGYFYEQVRYLCNHIGPRLTGSPQAAAAVEYVRRQMCALDFDVRLEPVNVTRWVRGKEQAELVRYPQQVGHINQKIVVTALGNTVATPPDGLSAPVIVVETFEELDRLPLGAVKGKVVLFDYRFDDFAAKAGRWEQAYSSAAPYRNEGPARAARMGAIASLVRSVGPRGLRLPHTGVTEYEKGAPQIPAAAVTAEDADLIANLASRGEVIIHLLLTPSDLPPVESYNVIADLKGSRFPEQIVLVSGHLDSWDLGTGALDDAAGVAVAMDALRVIKEINPRPKRTIRFVAWMDEENGGAGGLAYAEDHKSELHNHIAAVEIDFGDGRPLGLNVCGCDGRLAPISRVLHAIADPIGSVVNVGESPGVDLTAINMAGVPAIAPLQDARRYFQYHHTPADTFDKVRAGELRRTLELTAALIYALAQAE